MNDDWQGYLALAGVMKDRASDLGQEVACYRSSASRAYYGAYNRALADLSGPTQYVPKPKRGVSVHAEFRDHLFHAASVLDEPQQTQLYNIANILKRLWKYRKSADYDAKLENTPENLATLALTAAADVMMYLKAYLGTAAKQS